MGFLGELGSLLGQLGNLLGVTWHFLGVHLGFSPKDIISLFKYPTTVGTVANCGTTVGALWSYCGILREILSSI
jgi:hypothetical protein